MDELISRKQAIDALDKRFDSIPMEQTSEILLLRKDLRELPPEWPKRGKWITDVYGDVLCSECKSCAPQIMTGRIANWHMEYIKSKYCWKCGAKMEVTE